MRQSELNIDREVAEQAIYKMMLHKTISFDDVCEWWGNVSTSTVKRIIKEKNYAVINIRKTPALRMKDVINYIEEQEREWLRELEEKEHKNRITSSHMGDMDTYTSMTPSQRKANLTAYQLGQKTRQKRNALGKIG